MQAMMPMQVMMPMQAMMPMKMADSVVVNKATHNSGLALHISSRSGRVERSAINVEY